jgi:hypothetical protein
MFAYNVPMHNSSDYYHLILLITVVVVVAALIRLIVAVAYYVLCFKVSEVVNMSDTYTPFVSMQTVRGVSFAPNLPQRLVFDTVLCFIYFGNRVAYCFVLYKCCYILILDTVIFTVFIYIFQEWLKMRIFFPATRMKTLNTKSRFQRNNWLTEI